MPYFFNGRLYISPATMSAINDDAMNNQNLSVGNVAAYVGRSTGGEPNTALTFGSPAQAKATLKSGELLTAVLKAFNPSNETGGPASVVGVRVNPALPSTLTLLDAAAAPVINVQSADYGLYTKQINLSVGVGTAQGLKATVALGTANYSQDNLYSAPFEVQYTGAAASASLSVTNSTLTLEAPTGTNVATIDLNAFPTVQQLVDNINSFAGFTAVINGGAGNAPTLNGLDNVTGQDIKTAPFDVPAVLQAVVNWLNGSAQPLVTATRVAGAGTLPAVLPVTYLSGGSDGVTTNEQWSDALTVLQGQAIQWVTPVTSDPGIHAMTDAHVQFMSTIGRAERRAVVGMPLGTTDDLALAEARSLNSDRTSLVHIGYYDYDPTGILPGLQLNPPYLSAAAVSGAFSGVSPGTPLTNKSLTFRGLERDLLNPTDTDPLITGGVLCIENTRTGYKVVQSISTWLTNTNYDKVEQSVGSALDFVAHNVRNALDVLRGAKNNQITLARSVSITESQLRQLAIPDPQGPGVLAGDATNPPYKNITASTVGDAIAVSFQCSPVLPANYIAVTIYAVPFTGTVSA
ncbi:hypothetical protein [Paraburkholderia sp. MM6662-R1]|uniref:hypothetical protein n=1 Tax=Paraburkholderia sp. MM6662-R1 TaxID=2991066 RepID=UPI003D21A341